MLTRVYNVYTLKFFFFGKLHWNCLIASNVLKKWLNWDCSNDSGLTFKDSRMG